MMLRVVLVAVLFLLVPSVAQAQARIALLIGNQGYNAKVGPLKNPHNDIALIGAALEKLGFKITLVKDADYRSIDAAIKRHVQNVRREGQGAISFVYYSGHGAADPDTKINYVIPVDVANADDEDLWNYSLNLNTVVEGLRAQAPGATHYVVFDACRNELNLTRKGQKALVDKGFVPIAAGRDGRLRHRSRRTASDIGSGAGIRKGIADEIVKPGIVSMFVFTRGACSEIGKTRSRRPRRAGSVFSDTGGAKPMAPPPSPSHSRSGADVDEREDMTISRSWAYIKQSGKRSTARWPRHGGGNSRL
jgi:hypothetical protein